MIEWIQGLIMYPGIVFLMFLENIIPPIPSELILTLGGFKSGKGELHLGGVIAAGTLGALLGQLPLYYLGKWVGEERLIAWADKYGKWLTLSGDDIRKADKWFDRYGPKIVFFGRMLPGVRSFISLPAGLSGMPLGQFLLYSTIGIAIWNTILASLGYYLGDNYMEVEKYLGPATYIILVVSVTGAIVQVIRRKIQKKQEIKQ
jgi:membrane protein DedA with SNARE-associated domain